MNKRIAIVAVIVVVLVALAALFRIAGSGVRVLTIEGTITWISVADRQVSLQYISPRKGKLREKTVKVPEDCEIHLNSKLIGLNDNGELQLLLSDNTIHTITSSEIQLRPMIDIP